jgi:hypothetical protein
MTESAQHPMIGDEALIAERLRMALAEVDRLNAELEPARYLQGAQGCAGEGRECPEYIDEDGNERTNLEWCSHVVQRVATFADVHARELLDQLVRDVRKTLLVEAPEPAVEWVKQIVESIDNQLEDIDQAVSNIGGTEARSLSDIQAASAELRAEREAWLKDPGRPELQAALRRNIQMQDDLAKARRQLAEVSAERDRLRADCTCCDAVRFDDDPDNPKPCVSPDDGSPVHVDADGDTWRTVPVRANGEDHA